MARHSGRITIDGVDINNVPLASLRRALAVVPQDPHMFAGTSTANRKSGGVYDAVSERARQH
jgi:ATP-binding cassette subfamily B protein